MRKQEMNDRLSLPDRNQRLVIASELDRNMLVEAAAGTGKTSSMVSRMVALLAGGKCTAGTMAAVTFTRKAAAELRSRFQIALEKAVGEASGEAKELLANALEHVEGCFIGTIHSFCARLLRERPVEAGVNLAFEELEEQEDRRLREEAWDDFAGRLFVEDRDSLLADLETLGLRLSEIKDSFLRFADYPDIEEWPVPGPEFSLPPLEPVIRALRDYAEHMSSIAQSLPMETGPNRIGYQYERIRRMVRHANLEDPPALVEILRLFSPKPPSASKGGCLQ
jgi:ATP-dependent helicase/nuclease subunit A